MPIDPSQGANQAASTLVLTASESETAQAMPEIHEGERLQALLDANRYEKKELADAVGVTKQAVQQWTKQKRFTPQVWEKIVIGLDALRLSPAEIRPTETINLAPVEDLTRLVENWSRVQLSVLKRILESNDTPRRVLLAYVNGALRDRE